MHGVTLTVWCSLMRLADICVISLCTSISRKLLRVSDFMMFVFTICGTLLRYFRLRQGQT